MSCCNTKIVENQLDQVKLFTVEKKIRELFKKKNAFLLKKS